jgi:hypothetical protein
VTAIQLVMAEWTEAQRRALARMIAPKTRREEVEADLEHERDLTPEQKDVRIQHVLRLAWETLRTRHDRDRVIEPEPPAPDFEAIWRRLVEKHRETR